MSRGVLSRLTRLIPGRGRGHNFLGGGASGWAQDVGPKGAGHKIWAFGARRVWGRPRKIGEVARILAQGWCVGRSGAILAKWLSGDSGAFSKVTLRSRFCCPGEGLTGLKAGGRLARRAPRAGRETRRQSRPGWQQPTAGFDLLFGSRKWRDKAFGDFGTPFGAERQPAEPRSGQFERTEGEQFLLRSLQVNRTFQRRQSSSVTGLKLDLFRIAGEE
jgi:hypothetical protein